MLSRYETKALLLIREVNINFFFRMLKCLQRYEEIEGG